MPRGNDLGMAPIFVLVEPDNRKNRRGFASDDATQIQLYSTTRRGGVDEKVKVGYVTVARHGDEVEFSVVLNEGAGSKTLSVRHPMNG